MKRMIAAALLATLGTATVLGQAVAAGKPVGIVLEVKGNVSPAPLPFTEVERDLMLSLAPGASVSVVLYAECTQYDIYGGQARIGEYGVEVMGGSVKTTTVGCAERVALDAGSTAQAGGMVLRSEKFYVAPRFELLVVGDGAAEVSQAQIRRPGGQIIATLAIAGGRLNWGANAGLANGLYELVIAGFDPVEIEVGSGKQATFLTIEAP